IFIFIFFFQAEDGIRDGHVTGVQTCALPISLLFFIEQLRQLLSRKKSKAQIVAKIEDQLAVRSINKMIESTDVIMIARGDLGIRSEERRVGKECRSGWSAYD